MIGTKHIGNFIQIVKDRHELSWLEVVYKLKQYEVKYEYTYWVKILEGRQKN